MNYIIETKNLTKKYRKDTALDNVSIKVDKGIVYGLLGPNGSGKSTLLKLITQVLKNDGGEILFNNHIMTEKDLSHIGAIIEGPAIYPNLTAKENLKVITTLLNIDEKRIDEVLNTVGLNNTGDKIARDFSLGMKQRLGIAMAIINSPDLLILDEPTNGLDPVGIIEIREMVKNFSNRGITVIFCSHILNEVEAVADKIAIINNGHLSYEYYVNGNENLEELLMDIIRKEGI